MCRDDAFYFSSGCLRVHIYHGVAQNFATALTDSRLDPILWMEYPPLPSTTFLHKTALPGVGTTRPDTRRCFCPRGIYQVDNNNVSLINERRDFVVALVNLLNFPATTIFRRVVDGGGTQLVFFLGRGCRR